MDKLTDLVDASGLLVAILALTLAVIVMAKAWKPLRATVRFLDRLIGSHDEHGLLDRMTTLEEQNQTLANKVDAQNRALVAAVEEQNRTLVAKVDGIYHETHRNDGSSIKDAVDRIEKNLEQMALKQATDNRRLNLHLAGAADALEALEALQHAAEAVAQKVDQLSDANRED